MDESRLLSGKPLLVIVFALLLSLALIALDQTIVATALPVIVSDFNALQDVTWIIGGYLLTMVAFTPIYGQALTMFPTKWWVVISGLDVRSTPNNGRACAFKGLLDCDSHLRAWFALLRHSASSRFSHFRTPIRWNRCCWYLCLCPDSHGRGTSLNIRTALPSCVLGQSAEIRYRAIIFGAIGALFSLSSVLGPLLGGRLSTILI